MGRGQWTLLPRGGRGGRGGGCLLKKKQHCKCTDFSRSSGMKVLTRSRGSPSSAKLNDLRVLQRWVRLARWRRRLRQSPRRRPPPPPAAHASPLGEHGGQNCGSVCLPFRSNCRRDATMTQMTITNNHHPPPTHTKPPEYFPLTAMNKACKYECAATTSPDQDQTD